MMKPEVKFWLLMPLGSKSTRKIELPPGQDNGRDEFQGRFTSWSTENNPLDQEVEKFFPLGSRGDRVEVVEVAEAAAKLGRVQRIAAGVGLAVFAADSPP